MRKILQYTKNVTGTNAFWNDVKGKLEATINQVGAPTIFWIFILSFQMMNCLNQKHYVRMLLIIPIY